MTALESVAIGPDPSESPEPPESGTNDPVPGQTSLQRAPAIPP